MSAIPANTSEFPRTTKFNIYLVLNRQENQPHWVVHQWQLYERSLCSLLELQARKRTYGVCCSPRYVLAPEYAPHLLPLPLAARHSPPPAHL
ncbi:unnamed protein product [Euphydryas editha]|uniref:Uncharacterized protein n=1 Tax=Euphydryas editha TaxID=104508 RepID=A0AAU9U5K6_EUPED|nr:unnamed protein product [Euphydryas editha]